jgi:hypothetical protein
MIASSRLDTGLTVELSASDQPGLVRFRVLDGNGAVLGESHEPQMQFSRATGIIAAEAMSRKRADEAAKLKG